MATALTEEIVDIRRDVARFAEQYIANREDLYSMDGFPYDIWGGMGERGLLGLSLPVEYGGLGGSYLSIAVAGEALMQRGHNRGIVLSWLIHHAISRFLIMGFGNKRHHDAYLKDLASGKITASFAVSEPGRGANPKHLETSAHRQDSSYVLEGEKAYLTNGPIADLFIVVAATGNEDGRKRFTAFIVPKDTPGLSMTEPMKLGFFRPSPHGGIILSDCSVPMSSVLGEEGSAYEDMVKPFREVEDALMMGPLVGGMGRQIELLLDHISKQHVKPTDELKKDLGEAQSVIHTLRIVAYEAVSMLDSPIRHPEFRSLSVAFRNLSSQFQSLFGLVADRIGLEENTELNHMTNDLVRGADMGKNIALLNQKKLGERLLSGKEFDEIAQ